MEQVLTDTSFEVVQQNMNEFTGCGMMAKVIRESFAPLVHNFFDADCMGRLTATFKQIQLEDTEHKKGERSILLAGRNPRIELLDGFDFRKGLSFQEVADVDCLVEIADSGTYRVKVDIERFDASKKILNPAGATHFRFINAHLYLSDYLVREDGYAPSNRFLNGNSSIVYSDYFDLNSKVKNCIIIGKIKEVDTKLKQFNDTSIVCCVGIEFYQKVGEKYYSFVHGNSLTIKCIY